MLNGIDGLGLPQDSFTVVLDTPLESAHTHIWGEVRRVLAHF